MTMTNVVRLPVASDLAECSLREQQSEGNEAKGSGRVDTFAAGTLAMLGMVNAVAVLASAAFLTHQTWPLAT